jgi:hypothetical protein
LEKHKIGKVQKEKRTKRRFIDVGFVEAEI